MTFGQKIECRRKELGYTQSELAQKVNTTIYLTSGAWTFQSVVTYGCQNLYPT